MKAATNDSERKQLLSGNTANPFYQVSEAVLRRGESVGEAEETMVQEEDRLIMICAWQMLLGHVHFCYKSYTFVSQKH